MITFDASGVKQALSELKYRLTDASTVGQVIKLMADIIWIPNIARRFAIRKARSGYRGELASTMAKLDPDFVRRLSGTSGAAWAQKTELERRGQYARMGITKEVINALNSSPPMQEGTALLVGIGDIDKLNNLTQVGGSGYYLWQLLEYGTGVYGPSGRPVIRTQKQIFYDRDGSKKGILIASGEQTINPGFKGRHAFLDVNGQFYKSETQQIDYLTEYLEYWVKKLSYK